MIEILDEIYSSFEQNENRARAVQMEAYMRNQFKFLGITAKHRTDLIRPIWTQYRDLIKLNWLEITDALWNAECREYQMVAMELMKKVQKQMQFEDLDFLLGLVKRKSWWDTVDFLATNPIGYVVYNNRANQKALAKTWIVDKDMWIQRVALIHQLKFKEEVNLDILFYCIQETIHSKEFFIQKAAGWSLREASKLYPREIRSFVNKNPFLSNLSRREASKYL